MSDDDATQGSAAPGGASAVAPQPLPIDPTGVPNLDLVLGGGLQRGSLVLVVGPPGSGKTTLAGQLAFAAAAAGRRGLILTALSEPVSKLLAHLRTFRFFDEALVGDRLRVHSLQQFLPQGLASTGRELAAIVRAERAGFVVLDGFSGLRDADGGPQGVRLFLYDLGAALSLQGATTVVTTEGEPHDPALYQEVTTADVIVGLETARDNVRSLRWLEVVKSRGTAPLTGLHGWTLGAAGGAVHPRLEARVTGRGGGRAGDPPAPADDRAAFDLSGLDAVLGGGLPRETTTVVLGGVGMGKTLLGLGFALAGAAAGEPTVYLSLRESRRQLLRQADAFVLGPRLRAALAPDGGLTLLRRPPVELDIERLADDLLAALDRTAARRLVLDSIAEWERAVGEGSDPRRVPNHLAALVEAVQARRVTALIIKEAITEDGEADAPNLDRAADILSPLVENVLRLHEVVHHRRTHRVLSLPKLRFAPHDAALYEFVIAPPEGIRVLGPFRGDQGVLEALTGEDAAPTPAAPPPGGAGAGSEGATGAAGAEDQAERRGR